jgi:asparagine synthase (glutamine-hydrolysing)
MCGISGFYSANSDFNYDDLVKMTDVMVHRGPDASGYFFDNIVGLGHRRLSIIDLSEAANQPMFSHSDRYVMVFNGEIYNYQEIATELPHKKWKTTSDTEVILEAFIEWGPSFANQMNGMFAIAIYDKEINKLFLFRDRLGIKPIYYFWDGSRFAFGSELKALKALPIVEKQLSINKKAIGEFLNLGYIPEPDSIFNNIYKFPSGSYAEIKDKKLEFSRFWNVEEKIGPDLISDEVEAKSKLKELLISSVNYRLICDVPFGTFLSGGIDSSTVTAIAQSINSKPVNTFSIGFKDAKHNESNYAKSVAEYLGTNHYEFTVTEKDAIELIPELMDIYDEPYADSSAIPTMLVSKMARKHVTMTLSGDGGDELFFGYGAYNWAERLNKPFYKLARYPIAGILSMLDNHKKRAAQVFKYNGLSNIKSHIFSQEQYLFSESEVSKLLTPSFQTKLSYNENFTDLKRQLSPAEAQSLFDIKYYLKDDLLVKVDRATMKYSLETRVPLLDYRIVEFAMNLSPDLKIKNGVQKYLLKQVLYDYIPEEFFARPKWGFSIPLQKWLKADLRFLIEEYLNETTINKYKVVDYKIVSDLKHRFFNKNEDYLYNRLWLLIVLHNFLEKEKSITA